MKNKLAQKTYSIIALVAASKMERDVEVNECLEALEFLNCQIKGIKNQIAFYRIYEEFYQSTIKGLESDLETNQYFLEIIENELIKLQSYEND
ncbi:hypothetical protein [Pleomorphovibrio marinus]|uniref:hypothetical protein n=1 Tax=Pleomorphovibrio marinus TaxID=2164132 RepID=UPI000E0A01CE|nr:hypothetical protein [Pleomorphovibrio marinus]